MTGPLCTLLDAMAMIWTFISVTKGLKAGKQIESAMNVNTSTRGNHLTKLILVVVLMNKKFILTSMSSPTFIHHIVL